MLLTIKSSKPFRDKSPRQVQVDRMLEAYEDHECIISKSPLRKPIEKAVFSNNAVSSYSQQLS